MIIDVYSDMHLDTWKRYLGESVSAKDFHIESPESVDLVVVAGDQGNGPSWSIHAERLMQEIYGIDCGLIMIPGNHDFYDMPIPEDRSLILEAFLERNEHVRYILNDHAVTVGACTMWTDFRGFDHFGLIAARYINDFVRIPALAQSPKPWEILRDICRDRLKDIAAYGDDIIVTHFPPFINSVHPKFAGDELNPYFVNDFEVFFHENFKKKPKLWIHGHTHSTFDYMIGNTRVVSNPIGYPGENQEPPFRPKRIEI